LPAQQSARTDWLGLAQSQIKRSANISYYHLNGEIELAQEKNLDLRDRSSREGMIETTAYNDLAELARAAVNELQNQMQSVRDAWRKTKQRRIPPETLRAHAKTMTTAGKALVEKYDFKKDRDGLGEEIGKKAAEKIQAAVEAFDELGETLKLQEEEREGLLEAAGFGLAIGVAVHEISKLAGAIVSDAKRLRGKSASAAKWRKGARPPRSPIRCAHAPTLCSERRNGSPRYAF
jgi:hypothetical protein